MLNILRFPRPNELKANESLLAEIGDKHGISIKVADANIRTADDVAELLSFWRPDGCIVNNDILPASSFDDYPTVFHHRVMDVVNPLHGLITFDEKSVAEEAARHLLACETPLYAYVPSQPDEQWSRARSSHFTHIMGLNGHGVAVYKYPAGRLSAPKLLAHLGNWIANLPHPVGVFAANDAVAAKVIVCCDHMGLEIPNDVVVLGVDNDEAVCETMRPTLSSIATDVMTTRSESYRLLLRLISGKHLESPYVTVKPLGVIRRASTLRTKKFDAAVAAACDLIRRRACEGLKARDVAATFPCGRRMAEIRFRAMLGHSILEEIRAVRRAHAIMSTTPFRTQLRDKIAAQCGYSSWSSVHRLLKG